MSFVALGLFILACGWNLYRDYQPSRTNALRSVGHPQYFGAVIAAGFLFLLACCVHQAAWKYDAYQSVLRTLVSFSPRTQDAKPKEETDKSGRSFNLFLPMVLSKSAASIEMKAATETESLSRLQESKASLPPKPDDFINTFGIAIWCAFLTFLLPSVLNAPFALNRRVALLSAYSDLEEIERFAVDATQRGLALALTLSNGKFYVGVPTGTSQDGTADTKWLQIQPLASGKRDENGTLAFTTVYGNIYSAMDADDGEPRSRSDFRTLIPVDQIVTVQFFDLDLYTRRFAANHEADDQPLADALRQVLEGDGIDVGAITETIEGDPLLDSRSAFVDDKSDVQSQMTTSVNTEMSEVEQTGKLDSEIPDWFLTSLQWAALASIVLSILMLPVSLTHAALLFLVAVSMLLILAGLPSGRWHSQSTRVIKYLTKIS